MVLVKENSCISVKCICNCAGLLKGIATDLQIELLAALHQSIILIIIFNSYSADSLAADSFIYVLQYECNMNILAACSFSQLSLFVTVHVFCALLYINS